jgi:hypothetical protein
VLSRSNSQTGGEGLVTGNENGQGESRLYRDDAGASDL